MEIYRDNFIRPSKKPCIIRILSTFIEIYRDMKMAYILQYQASFFFAHPLKVILQEYFILTFKNKNKNIFI